MRIGIDIQTLSTYEASRGIGRLCLQLIGALKHLAPEHTVSLFGLTAEAPESVRPLLCGSVRYCPIAQDVDAAEHLRLGCSAPFLWTTPEALDLDVYHVTSPFMPDILLPLGGGIPIVATLLDAIPAVMREQRQPILSAAGWEAYMVRRNVVAGYQHFLPISESAAGDCARTLDLPRSEMTVTYVPIDQRPGRDVSADEEARVLSRFGLGPGYVVSVTGFHERKNIMGTLRSFASMPASVRRAHRLVLVCALQETEKAVVMSEARRLGIEDEVVLTGYVSDRELIALVRGAGVMLFASKYEGFGIPVAEAFALGVPVVASNTSSLPEVVGDAGFMHDPDDHSAFGDSMRQLLQTEALRREHAARGLMQVARFAPEAFVQRLLAGYRAAIDRQHLNKATEPVSITVSQPLRVAVFSPLSPCMSGVADYTEQLLLHLGDLAHCECFIEKYLPAHHLIRARFDCWEHSAFCARHATAPYDVILYQVGNNILHAYTLPYAERYPGVVVFHDFSLLGVHRILAQRFGERRAAQERFSREYPYGDAACWEDDALTGQDVSSRRAARPSFTASGWPGRCASGPKTGGWWTEFT
jgi:glycosyltransferase involved in cell wall biosynthesis